jgi:hypothetical protein
MKILSFHSDAMKRYALAAVTLCYALSLAVLPAHGHGLGLWNGVTQETEAPTQPAPDFHLDCFLCQVLTTVALPVTPPELSPSFEFPTVDAPQPVGEPAPAVKLGVRARAPPAL